MEYQVPQFIEVEDKIFGPLTLKQFIYLAGGAGLCAIIILYLPFFFAVVLALPIAAFAAALAFYKVNGKPFIEIVEAGFMYIIGNRLFLWRKEKNAEIPLTEVTAPVAPVAEKSLTRGKLKDLAWALDVKDTGNPDKL